jgi:hypothetical protein
MATPALEHSWPTGSCPWIHQGGQYKERLGIFFVIVAVVIAAVVINILLSVFPATTLLLYCPSTNLRCFHFRATHHHHIILMSRMAAATVAFPRMVRLNSYEHLCAAIFWTPILTHCRVAIPSCLSCSKGPLCPLEAMLFPPPQLQPGPPPTCSLKTMLLLYHLLLLFPITQQQLAFVRLAIVIMGQQVTTAIDTWTPLYCCINDIAILHQMITSLMDLINWRFLTHALNFNSIHFSMSPRLVIVFMSWRFIKPGLVYSS